MKLNFAKTIKMVTVFIVFISLQGYSQQGTITINKIDPFICLSTEFTIQFTPSLSVPNNAVFSIEVRSDNPQGKITYEDIDSKPDQITSVIKSISENYWGYENIAYLSVRVVAKNTSFSSNWIYLVVKRKGDFNTVVEAGKIYFQNKYSTLPIPFNANGSFPFEVFFNDGSSYFLKDRNALDSFQPFLFTVTNSINLKVSSVNNICGINISNQATIPIVVNPNTLLITNPPQLACIGDSVFVNIEGDVSSLVSKTKFFAKLTNYYRDSEFREAIIEGKLSGKTIQFKLPNELKNSAEIVKFKVEVFTNFPENHLVPFDLQIYETGYSELLTPSISEFLGFKHQLKIHLNGLDPFKYNLSNANTITGQYDSFYRPLYSYVAARPEKNTEYYIRTFQSGCQENTIAKSSVIINNNKTILVDSLLTGLVYCIGNTVRIKVKTNFDLYSTKKLTVKLYNSQYYDPSSDYLGAIDVRIEANDILSFELPPNRLNLSPYILVRLFNEKSQLIFFDEGSQLTPEYTKGNNYYLSEKKLISIKRKIGLYATAKETFYTFPSPSYLFTWYQLTEYVGDYVLNPIKLNYNDNQITDSFEKIFADKSAVYTLNSIENICGKTDLDIKLNVTITDKDKPQIFLKKTELTSNCKQDSTILKFTPRGKFESNNVFQLFNGANERVSALIVNDIIKFAKKENTTGDSFYLKSTSPEVKSDIYSENIWFPAEMADLVSVYPVPLNYLPGEKINLIVKQIGTGHTFSVFSAMSDGKLYSYNDLKDFTINSLEIPIQNSHTITLKSIESSCGIKKINGTINVKVLPVRLSILNYDTNGNYIDFLTKPLPDFKVCENTLLPVKFMVEGDYLNKSITLQIDENSTGVFKDYSSESASSRIIKLVVPSNTNIKKFSIRLIEKTSGAVSEVVNYNIDKKPTATILNSASQVLEQGAIAKVNLVIEGVSPIYCTFSDAKTFLFNAGNPVIREFVPQQKGVLTLLEVSNQCGYGQVQGAFSYKLKPKLITNYDETFLCKGGKIKVNYKAIGDFEPDTKYELRISLKSGNNFQTASSSQKITDTLEYTIPPSVNSGDVIFVKLLAIGTVGVAETDKILKVYDKPSMKIVNTDTEIINLGQEVTITLQNDFLLSPSNIISYKFNDGTGISYKLISEIIKFKPNQTTDYKIVSVNNVCGEGVSIGSKTVIVNTNKNKSITIEKGSVPNKVCKGDSLKVIFSSLGFSNFSTFRLEISDTLGQKYSKLSTTRFDNILKGVIPLNINSGLKQRVRVVCNEDEISSNSSIDYLIVANKASIAFKESVYFLKPFENGINLPVLLMGDGPWFVSYMYDNKKYNLYYLSDLATTLINLNTINSSNNTIKLLEIQGLCGLGIVKNPSSLLLEQITANEEAIVLNPPIVYPNPFLEELNIDFRRKGKFDISIYNSLGNKVLSTTNIVNKEKYILELSNLPPGVYILDVCENDKSIQAKIIKR